MTRHTLEEQFTTYSIIVREPLQVKIFIENLKLDQIIDNKVKLLCDHQTIITTIKMGKVGLKGKYIELQYHYLLVMIQRDELHVNYVTTKKNVC